MKSLILLSLLIAPAAHAVDTSGCSPLSTKVVNAASAGGNPIRATLSRAANASCWNSDESSIQLRYTFAMTQGAAQPRVSMYTRVNGVERSVDATVQCGQAGSFSMGADTSGPATLTCNAYAVVPAPTEGSVSAEVAVQVNGQWDTKGGQNTKINF